MSFYTQTITFAALCALLAPVAHAAEVAEVAKSRGNAFNPDISVNLLSLWQASDGEASPEDGFALQEVELQFSSDIDPFWRASALLAVENEDGEWGLVPEEVYAETIAIPSLTLRVGKFKAYVGKSNTLHTHAFPFLESPLINTALLGDEGLNEAGVSAAYLLPTDAWFSELTVQVLDGESADLFGSPTSGDVATNIHWANLVELNDALTGELGLTSTLGKNSAGGDTSLMGVDLTFKYRPLEGGKYKSIAFSTEYLTGNRENFSEMEKVDGLASALKYQFLQRWNAGARYEVLGLAQKEDFARTQKMSAILGYDFSEFSQLRLQYDRSSETDAEAVQHVGLQLNISMGAHPAHAY
jgi:hypothetical protein